MKKYLDINKHAWNTKTDIHIKSVFYENEAFLKGKNTLKDIEISLLGDVKGKNILHLQCHFGQDSISLARMGAHVTAVDLSDKAIDRAKYFAKQTDTNVNFICADIYDLPKYLNEKFDIVFTSYGVIGWLPDLSEWGKLISYYLKCEGRFVIAEFHPVVWMFDNDFKNITYNYFNDGEIVETVKGSYVDRNADISYETITWNHSTSEVLNSLIDAGIEIKGFNELDYSPYNCFAHTEEFEAGKFRIKHLGNKIPMIFIIDGVKK